MQERAQCYLWHTLLVNIRPGHLHLPLCRWRLRPAFQEIFNTCCPTQHIKTRSQPRWSLLGISYWMRTYRLLFWDASNLHLLNEWNFTTRSNSLRGSTADLLQLTPVFKSKLPKLSLCTSCHAEALCRTKIWMILFGQSADTLSSQGAAFLRHNLILNPPTHYNPKKEQTLPQRLLCL